MKRFVLALLPVFSATTLCFGQSTTFHPETGQVDIPCFDVWDSRQVVGVYQTYRASLQRVGLSREFVVTQTQPVPYGDDCSGSFDIATDLYRDIVNIGDDSYDVRLRRTSGNLFTLEAHTHRGPGTTSMWVARNGAHTVYLAGTIHILRPGDYPLPRAFTEAYAQAAALYFEIDMDDPAETGESLTQAQILQLFQDPQGQTLTQVLAPATHAALRTYMQSRGLSIDAANAWSAQMLVNLLTYREVEMNFGFTAEGVDGYFADRAMQDGKAIHGLETSALQHNVLQGLDEGREDELVANFLEDLASGVMAADLHDLVAIWRNGDTRSIFLDSIAPMREHAQADYLLLHANRNRAWLPQIETMLQTPETEMVVVGVAHMAGDEGLVTLLRQRGYLVEKH